MNNWKEEFDKIGWMGNDKVRKEVFTFISTKIIQKLIDDIADDKYCEEDMKMIKQQLRAKWLGKE